MYDKTCWNCGHYAFGCFVRGEYNPLVDIDSACDKWCPEGTKGTVTDHEEINDGTSWAENEYLKDDESNL